jgi:hypothetical protein
MTAHTGRRETQLASGPELRWEWDAERGWRLRMRERGAALRIARRAAPS